MALRIIRRGNTGLSNDHNLLLNREMQDQHPVEAITGLRPELDSKYTMPSAGIPKKDLAFNAAEMQDVNDAKNALMSEITRVDNSIINIDSRTTAVEDWVHNVYPTFGNNSNVPNLVDIEVKTDIYEEFIAVAGQTDFPLSTNYQPGNNSLKVYKNGSLMRLNEDYEESSDTLVKFISPLDEGDFVTCISDGRTNINSPIHEEYEYTGGDTTFNLAYRYNKGDNGLSVYLNGIRLNVNREYEEIDDYTVHISKPMVAGDIVVFRRETHMAAEVELMDGSDYTQSTWKERFTVTAANTNKIVLSNTFVPGSKTLQVFVGGLLMTYGVDFDYVEVDDHTIQFNYMLDIGDSVDVVCAAGLYQWYELFISIEGQVLFICKNRYSPGKGDILVYEDGLLLTIGDDYKEINYNTVKFNEAPIVGSKVVVYKRR